MADRYVLAKRLGLSVGVLALVASLIVIYICCWYYPQTTVIVLRHAEKATNSNDDSVPLRDPEGIARAATLAQVAERAGVTVIYVTQALRTQQTAAPLATNLGITPIQFDSADVDGLINDVRASRNRGRVIVIVGHSNTVPVIVDRLGGGAVTVGDQFDNLFVLTLNRWSGTKLIQATYGAPR